MAGDVTIRNATPEDVDTIVAIYEPMVTETAISFEEAVPSPPEMRRRLDRSLLWLVAEEAEAVIGYAYAAPFHERSAYRWSAEVSIYLSEKARGRGIGRLLVGKVLDRLRETGYVNAFAGVALPNESSVRLFESFGFVKIAHQSNVGFKLGRWHDVAWWQLELRPPTVPPPTLVPSRRHP